MDLDKSQKRTWLFRVRGWVQKRTLVEKSPKGPKKVGVEPQTSEITTKRLYKPKKVQNWKNSWFCIILVPLLLFHPGLRTRHWRSYNRCLTILSLVSLFLSHPGLGTRQRRSCHLLFWNYFGVPPPFSWNWDQAMAELPPFVLKLFWCPSSFLNLDMGLGNGGVTTHPYLIAMSIFYTNTSIFCQGCRVACLHLTKADLVTWTIWRVQKTFQTTTSVVIYY